MTEKNNDDYQVLARKYRPATFSDLIGQDIMVRTLTNAFKSDRIAQAFILTGIRGTGKTTTARIISKGMNCIGPDGKGNPTTEPCNKCEQCNSIAEGRHVDVIEMDAASRTGVGDIREIIDSVKYRAASARFKIYIIDEVHMLSTSAFNALLKTLEEPPEHVKFIFATTEIQKIPITVLSRCQRFDLRRIEPAVMMEYLRKIAELEKVEISEDAIAMITRASEGSVRDGISLLDQSFSNSTAEIEGKDIRDMLGLSDRGRILDLFNLIVSGNTLEALNELSSLYSDGADPKTILHDLAEVSHWVSLIKITPEAADDPTISSDERFRGRNIAEGVSIKSLSRMWQMLLVSIDEIRLAPNAMMTAEMAVIRLTYVAELPSPEELIKTITKRSQNDRGKIAKQTPTSPNKLAQSSPGDKNNLLVEHTQNKQAVVRKLAVDQEQITSFYEVIELIKEKRDLKLLVDVETSLKLVKFTPGLIEFEPTKNAPKDLAHNLGKKLTLWSGRRWAVSIVNQGGNKTISEQKLEKEVELQELAKSHTLVKTAMAVFPEAKIINVKTSGVLEAEAALEALPEVSDDWDPFEES
tara:strand:- start:1110 stop:2855 length:1746 start_codon:yes stop_codon:yes gene_type:complete